MSKPSCKYGMDCYRLNPSHFEEFDHPHGHKIGSRKCATNVTSDDDTAPSCSKKALKVTDKPSNKFNLFFTKVHGIDDKWNSSSMAVDIVDILKLDAEELESSAQFNYMIDIDWLMSKYPAVSREKPLLIVTGGVDVEMRADAHKFGNITLASARLEMAYGTHHTKMMILKYRNGLRIVIHTANLIEDDWAQKTQGVWMSPLFPKVDDGTDSSTNFRSDLIDYLKSYKLRALDSLTDILKNYDFTAADVFLVASTPGRHTGANLNTWGHMKLRKLLKDELDASEINETWPVLAQFSSIGSLGAQPENWLTGEFRTSLSSTSNTGRLGDAPKLFLIYPTVENVRTCLSGYAGGGSLPYSIETARKQPYLKKFLHRWKCEGAGRSRAPPHIKSFARVDKRFEKMAWCLISSANLSKAAWGALEKNSTQLMIRSYELGVLFVPKNFGLKYFSNEDNEKFPFPYDLPLTTYSDEDEPWIVNIPYTNEPDTHGYLYKP